MSVRTHTLLDDIPVMSNTVLANETTYTTIESREGGTMDWGIFLTTTAPAGQYYHITKKDGEWQLESNVVDDILNPVRTIVFIRVDEASTPKVMDDVIRSRPVDGSASTRTGKAFSSQTWVEDCLIELFVKEVAIIPVKLKTFIEFAHLAVINRLDNTYNEANVYHWTCLDSDSDSDSDYDSDSGSVSVSDSI